jgi:hypothetical protein
MPKLKLAVKGVAVNMVNRIYLMAIHLTKSQRLVLRDLEKDRLVRYMQRQCDVCFDDDNYFIVGRKGIREIFEDLLKDMLFKNPELLPALKVCIDCARNNVHCLRHGGDGEERRDIEPV